MENTEQTIVRKVKGAKSLSYEVVHEGTVYARVQNYPLAERVAVLVNEQAAAAKEIIAQIAEGLGV